MDGASQRVASALADQVDAAATDRSRVVARARWLAWFTVLYNLVEGVVAVWFGAGEESLALLGFGIDSFIEMASAICVLWRLRAELGGAALAANRERVAGIAVSILLMLLGAGTMLGSAWQVFHHEHPSTTVPGLIVSLISLSFMVWLWRSKLSVAAALGSRTLRQDAACSLGCIQLSVTLLVGSLVYVLMPALWWADAVAASVIAVLIAREGWLGMRAASRGEPGGCGCGEHCGGESVTDSAPSLTARVNGPAHP